MAIPVLLTLLLIVILNRFGGCRFAHFFPGRLANMLKYPPAWCSGLGGTFLFLAVPSELPLASPSAIDWVCTIIILFILVALYDLLRILPKMTLPRFADHEDTRIEAHKTHEIPEELIVWIREEAPISDPKEDLFGFSVVAKRLADIASREGYPSAALVGPYGCGKSSTLNMMKRYIHLSKQGSVDTNTTDDRKPAKVIVSSVRGWGLQRTSVAKHILEKCISSLSQEADCLALSEIAVDYRRALAGSGSLWGKIMGEVLGRTEPERVLWKLDFILEALDARVVILLEDLNRNRSPHFLGVDAIALLDRLKDLARVSFVLTTDPDEITDLLRVCEHIEVLPAMPIMDTLKLIETFREHCRKTATEQHDLDPVDTKSRDAAFQTTRDEFVLGVMTAAGHLYPVKAMARLLNTPRLLKNCLRRGWGAWESLHGEVDVDELLVCCALRAGSPQAYEFLLSNLSKLRSVSVQESQADRGRKVAELKALWERHTASATFDVDSALYLAKWLFPAWEGLPSGRRIPGPQTIASSHPTDYWSRLNAEEMPPDTIRDQTVLHEVKAWKEGRKESKLLTWLLTDPDHVGVLEHLLQRGQVTKSLALLAEEIRELAELVFAEVLKRDGREASHQNAPGLGMLWRMILPNSMPSDEYSAWLWTEVEKALSVSISFSNDLMYYWGSLRDTPLDVDAKRQLRHRVIEWARKGLTGDRLTIVLGKEIDCLFQFVRQPEPDFSFGPTEWAWLAPRLTAALRAEPDLLVPQVAALLCKSQRRFDDRDISKPRQIFSYELEKDILKSLLPDIEIRRDLMKAFVASQFDESQLQGDAWEMVKSVRTQATDWLDQGLV